MKHRPGEKGQTALEFILIAPLLLGAIFLILGIALGWYSHALSSALALEGAAREAVSPGSGFALVEELQLPGQVQGSFTSSINDGGRSGKDPADQGPWAFKAESGQPWFYPSI